MNVQSDIKKTIDMVDKFHLLDKSTREIRTVPTEASDFDTYSKVFPFTNENVKNYYKNFKYDGDILTVAGSGDCLLHSILMDCNDIVMFDLNRLTYYYIALKLAAVKGLNFEEFKQYFTRNGWPGYPDMQYNLFKKIEEHLEPDTKEYWNKIYSIYQLNDNVYFQKGFFFFDGDIDNNAYFSEKTYNKLKQKVNKQRKIEFINSDILMLDDNVLNKNYSSIFLSNVMDYIDDTLYFKEFLLKKLVPTLDINGSIMYNYCWNKKAPYQGRNFTEITTDVKEKVCVYKNK